MADASTTSNQLQQVVEQLKVIAAKMGEKTVYQEQADKAKESYEKRREEHASTSKKGEQVQKKAIDSSTPSTLTANERKRFESIAACFNKILKVDSISKAIDKLRDSEAARDIESHRDELLRVKKTGPGIKDTTQFRPTFKEGSLWGKLLKWAPFIYALIDLASGPKTLLSELYKYAAKWSISALVKSFATTIDKLLYLVETPFKLIGKGIGSLVKFATKPLITIASKLGGNFLGRTLEAITKIFGSFFKGGLKALKFIPGIGSIISFYFAYKNFQQGDIVGGMLDVASGIAQFFPGIGTAIAVGLDIFNAFRNTGDKNNDEKITSESPGWFSKTLDSIGAYLVDHCYNWPVIGPIIRAVEHFKAGDIKQGLNSLAHVIPGISGILDLMGMQETSATGRVVESLTVDKVKGMADFLTDLMMSIPGVGSMLRALKHFAAGEFEAGFSQILPESVMNMYRKMGGKPTISNNIAPNTSSVPTTKAVSPIAASSSISPAAAPKIELTGLSELQMSIKQLGEEEIKLLNEQKNILNDNRILLKMLVDNTKNMQGVVAMGSNTNNSNIREEVSATRKNYIQSMNILGASLM